MKTDLTKTDRLWYRASSKPELVSLSGSGYLAIEGKGDPNDAAYGERLQALYSLAYALKFKFKAKGQDFVVAKLEGQWWFDEKKFQTASMSEAPKRIPRREWNYRSMIRMPEFVTREDLENIRPAVIQKKGLPHLSEVVYYCLPASDYIQILHTGPFSTEPESLAKMLDFMNGFELDRNGPHHEIYLSDFRKAPAEKLRTILREPVKIRS